MSMDITPPHLRCGMGSCPSVHVLEDGDYTPEHLRCVAGASCPSVSGYHGRLVIIGRKADGIATELGLGVGPDEAVIEIGEEYFSALPELVHLRSQVARLREALGCQADVTEKGSVPSPSALQKSAGEDARWWTREMRAAAMKDAQAVHDLHSSARFLLDRLSEYEPLCECDEAVREWHGHVEPAVARLEMLLAAISPRPDEERASAMSAHSESHHSPDTEDETPGGSQNPVSEPLP